MHHPLMLGIGVVECSILLRNLEERSDVMPLTIVIRFVWVGLALAGMTEWFKPTTPASEAYRHRSDR